jgi:hypothetical protein
MYMYMFVCIRAGIRAYTHIYFLVLQRSNDTLLAINTPENPDPGFSVPFSRVP